jgi:hypothetical protein
MSSILLCVLYGPGGFCHRQHGNTLKFHLIAVTTARFSDAVHGDVQCSPRTFANMEPVPDDFCLELVRSSRLTRMMFNEFISAHRSWYSIMMLHFCGYYPVPHQVFHCGTRDFVSFGLAQSKSKSDAQTVVQLGLF